MDNQKDAYSDPLRLHLKRQVARLLDMFPADSPIAALRYVSSRKVLLDQLSTLLHLPRYTMAIATLFKPLLLDLCARWLHHGMEHEEKFEALCLLLEPYQELYPVLLAFLRMPGLERGPLETSLATWDASEVPRLQRVLLAYYRLLQANATLPRLLGWSLAPLSQLIWKPHPDYGVRFMAIRCYAIQASMTEGERVKVEKQVLGEVSEVKCPLAFGVDEDGTARLVDGWVVPVLELERMASARDALLEASDYYVADVDDSSEPIHPAELSPMIANIHGVLMLRSSSPTQTPSSLIDTPTSSRALRQIALHLSMKLPVLLTSAPSSGKALLISHMARVLFPDSRNHVVTIHLADTSLDPRSLLGSYVSSPTRPGTFEWKEGVLVRAMREGKWVILKDIDRATMELLGILKPLVESLGADKWIGGRARLNVPSRGTVEAEESFALFATRSSQPSRIGAFPTPTFLGAHKFYEVVVDSPTTSDLRLIVDTKFPRLAGAPALALVNLWESVRALGSPASTRDIGLRELERLCTRVNGILPASYPSMDIDEDFTQPKSLSQIFVNPSVREEVLLEARDVFFGAGATTTSGRAHLNGIIQVVAEHLGLSEERRDWILHKRTPEFEVEKDVNGRISAIRAGRTRLHARVAKMDIAPPYTRPFAMHRPAVSLIARLATAVSLAEPVLLTGETGTGKTSVVTHLASLLHRPLISLNLSNQTESSDILGGFRPVDARVPGGDLQERFLELFGGTFSRKKNAAFEESVRKAVQERKWKRAAGLWTEAVRLAKDRIQAKQAEENAKELEGAAARKRRKTEGLGLNVALEAWQAFESDVRTFEVQHVQGKSKFAFAFVEGPLVKALRNGDWILLDEVNLATSETLESISGLLHGPTASITLTEQGSLEPIPRHPDFRLFACMNPANDVGKKDLPPNIRSRFTEIDVPPPDADKETLLTIVAQYIGACAVGDKGAIMDVADFYTAVKRLAEVRQIADGANHRPHFSMRTLARALTFASDMATSYSLRRALWEGCLMAFTMVLDGPSATAVTALAQKHILAGVRNSRSLLTKDPAPPGDPSTFVKFGPFYLERGPLPEDLAEEYIMTPSVETKLIDLARIIAAKRFPVLIEGPTSSGKTSSIEYLAKRTGHRFVRINNHEHTDIQEYIGTYVSDPVTGKLVFKEGLLVRALRQGDWIVLDELNLAPTDVLEALNRLLDDNRELLIPETQEVVRPHPHFMLFATQNPPGLYAGRKIFSRAFRNRFLEVHFEDVPQSELETILCQRCRIAPSYGQRIVSVFRELQKRRQSSRVFESKQGFATLRDLFRWAGRDAMSYDELAANGYMLLAERARRDDDKVVVKEVIESIMKVRVDESSLYNLRKPKFDSSAFLGCPVPSSSQVVWTGAMQRLFVLIARALRFNEPVLLVGETGCGKTSVCQLFAQALSRTLRTVNCHQNTETADLIGGLRPIRNKAALEAETLREAVQTLSQLGATELSEDAASLTTTIDRLLRSGSLLSDQALVLQDLRTRFQRLSALFEWRDGPLVEAMRRGDVFLLDEISLADDSVLERLNSVLETGRTIVLAERGGNDAEIPAIKAADDFKFVATMNPGGDYGKKELSPALRNRFTEIWVPPITDRRDLECIVETLWQHDVLKPYTQPLLDFVGWLCATVGDQSFANLRDILAWVSFSNATLGGSVTTTITPSEVFHHAAQMTLLDGLGSMPQLSAYSEKALGKLKAEAVAKLDELVPVSLATHQDQSPSTDTNVVHFGIFSVPRGPQPSSPQSFSLEAPTARDNVMRVVRACQLPKPIMLEGSPGVGKTSLVAALANMCGHHLCRINLSDQTDLVDLFGSDLPVEGGEPGQFSWKDAEFLRALQEGHWVLLDEMNLAPQSVLEGLNAVLDHRGTVYIPELGRSFVRHSSFRIFAAQNPLHQGGGRKGLPKSFLNRFTKVYVQEMSPNDLLLICQNLFPNNPAEILQKMIAYTSLLNEETMVKRSFAREGAPWEFNLRDVIRWATLLHRSDPPAYPSEYLSSVILQRFRTAEDRARAHELFSNLFPGHRQVEDRPSAFLSPLYLQIGHHGASRGARCSSLRSGQILQSSSAALESLGICIEHGWLAILTGPRSSGKTTLVRTMADALGKTLQEVSISSATDATDILGSFEETDLGYRASGVLREVVNLCEEIACSALGSRSLATSDYFARLHALTWGTSPSDVSDIVQTMSDFLDALDEVPEPYRSRWSRIQAQAELLAGRRSQVAHLEWVDGPLVQALKKGHWLLLDGANLCNPSVLDRLNSLCEIGGSLALNERGAVNGEVQVLRPHSDFRLFMCADSQYGELSRAMRNRGIEIAILPSLTDEDWRRVIDHIRCSPRFAVGTPDPRQVVSHHALLRRGLRGLSPSSNSRPWSMSANRLLVQDSTNAAVMELVPGLSSSSVITPGRAELYFVTAHVVPNAIHHLSRFLSFCNSPSVRPLPHIIRAFLKALECSHLYRTVILMRKNISQTSHIPPDALLAQPLYAISLRASSNQEVLLRYLRLFVAATADYGESFEDDDEDREVKRSNEPARLRHIATTCSQLLVNNVRHGATLLLGTVSLSNTEVDSVDTMLELVAFGRFLRTAIQSPTTFDFSLAIAISGWVKQTLRDISVESSIFGDIIQSTRALDEVISLTSGIGLSAIWTALASRPPADIDGSHVAQLDNADRCLRHSICDTKLRSQVLDVMSMWRLPIPSRDDHTKLLELTTQLNKRLLDPGMTEESIHQDVDLTYIFAQLYVLDSASRSITTSQHVLLDLIDYGCSDRNISLATLIPYRQLLWAVDAHEQTTLALVKSTKRWLEQIWSAVPIVEIGGPSAFCHPAELCTTVLACDGTPRASDTFTRHEFALRQRLSSLTSRLSGPTDRWSQIVHVLLRSTFILSACIVPSSTIPDMHTSTDIVHVIEWLDELHDAKFAILYQAALRPSLQALANCANVHSYVALGSGWIALSQLLMKLYVPNIPVDPAVVRQCSQRFGSEQRALLEDELILYRLHEERTAGRGDNPAIRYLLEMLQALDKHATSGVGIESSRSDVMRLHAYWTEVSQFLAQVISDAKVGGVVSALESGDTGASLREHVIQESSSAFSQRLDSIYADYADISMPIQFAILQLRLGLRLVADATSTDRVGSNEDTITTSALVTFPSIGGLDALPDITGQPSSTTFELALWRLSSTSLGVACGVELQSYMAMVESIYDQSLGLWLVDKARKAEEERQAQSLYRHKTETNDLATDAELEEQEFLALFPEYEDILEATPSVSSKPGQQKTPDILRPLAVRRLSILHRHLFSRGLHSVTECRLHLVGLQRELVRDILNAHAAHLPEVLDQRSRPYQISLLIDRLAVMHEVPRQSGRPFNFYADSNVPAIRESSNILHRMADRLSTLIQEWPEQMVLQHLKSRCDAILQLDIFSPVAKVLSAVEQLLLQMEDWEMYANKENTLRAYQNELATLVVSWRRLELTSWQGLLRTQALEFEDGSSEWWFRLYEATVRGVEAAAQEEENGDTGAVARYLEGLVPLLDEFMTSSPLGQFSARLDHLLAFESYCFHIGKRSHASRRVHRILRSTRAFYLQFLPRVTGSLSSQQQALEKEIRDFIKLASWKDINVHALKQSAQRTHRQLYKCVHKFKGILRQPVTAHLVPAVASSEEATSSSDHLVLQLSTETPTLPPFRSVDGHPDHLLNLDRTFRNFHSLIQARVALFISSLSQVDVEDLSSEVITTLQTLASTSVPVNANKEQREKFLKALLVRKRKAWSDLLKELKRIGLAVNMKPEVLEQQSNPRWLREQPVTDATIGPLDKSEAYLLRLSKLLPDLRTRLGNHHPDIGTRDLQRGTNLVESAFSLAIEARTSFVEAVQHYGHVQEAVARLRAISHQARIVASGPDLLPRIVSIKEDIGRLVNALDETVTIWQQYLRQVPETDILPTALEDLQSAQSATQTMFGRLNDVVTNVRLLNVPVLLEGEATVIQQALDHVRTVVQLLGRWTEGPNIVAHFVRPLLDWLEQRKSFTFTQFAHEHTISSTDSTGQLIDRLLLSVQAILALPPPPSKADTQTSETPDRFVREYNRLISQVTRSLKTDEVLSLLTTVVQDAVQAPEDELQRRLVRILPFLDTYLELARVQLTNHCAWTKALFKLDYVICSVMHSVARDGFCKPPEAGEGEAGEAGLEDAGGVGLGEGSGSENVSKDIQDESQVEGLQGEAGEDEDVERAEEGNALEMSEDIGGKMQDVEDAEEDEDEEEDKEEGEEPEEQVADLDAGDPSAVDEKLWGDESGPDEENKDQGKSADDHSTKQQENDSETVAKEDKERKSSRDKKDQQDQAAAQQEGNEAAQEEQALDEGVGEEEMEEGEQDQQAGAPLDDFVPDAETLDLPDDMDLGKDDGKEPDLNEDIEMGDEEDAEEEERPADELMPQDAEEEDGMDTEGDNPHAMQEDAAQAGPTDDIVDDPTAQPDLHAGTGQDSGQTGDQTMAEANQGESVQGASAGEYSGPEEATEREDTPSEEDSAPQQERSHEQISEPSANANQSAEDTKDGSGSTRSQTGASPSQAKPQPLQSNPLRSLGDALREISQRIDDILDSEGGQNNSERQQPDMTNASQLEYLHPEEEKGADEMQALGPAQQEDVAKLNDLKFLDDDMDTTDDVPLFEESTEAAQEQTSRPPQSALHAENTAQTLGEDVKSALTQTEIRSQQPGTSAADPSDILPSDRTIPSDDMEEAAQHAVELALRQWQAEGHPDHGAEEMWRRYEALTHDLSYALCEQLRLILEPTMATRLKGDYRTGKRLNMKKIIPYIASEFTKDKIWLRRTRPSQREYQVLIALDDSRSMAESHCVHLAFQTLALVSKALGKLEVGDIAIAKFGEAVDVLHAFDGGPFTDQAGTKVMGSFRFDQKATQVLSLVDTSLKLLEQARERRSVSSSSSADLWQLEIIISDGICQDHERLRTMLRRAEEQRVMIVFIILDSLHFKNVGSGVGGSGQNDNSILSMNQVGYKMVDGRMDLTVERYLDTFPFEYYVVLRNVEALPDVLSGTLKQFFERIAEA